MKINFAILILVLSLAGGYGCGKKAETEKTIDQVRLEAGKMSAVELEAAAKSYADKLSAKQADIEKFQNELRALTPAQMTGEKSKEYQVRANHLAEEVSALTARYQIYLTQYMAANGGLGQEAAK